MTTQDRGSYSCLAATFRRLGTARGVPAGAALAQQDDVSSAVHLLVRGCVKLVYTHETRIQRIVGVRTEGLVGGCCCLENPVQPLTISTLMPCDTYQLRFDVYRRLVNCEPPFTSAIAQAVAAEAALVVRTAALLTSGSGIDRVRKLLSLLAGNFAQRNSKGVRRLVIPLRQWEMAGMVAMTPEHFSRVLRTLECAGSVKREGGWVLLQAGNDTDRLGMR